jgi:hypothetical protein
MCLLSKGPWKDVTIPQSVAPHFFPETPSRCRQDGQAASSTVELFIIKGKEGYKNFCYHIFGRNTRELGF